MLDKLLTCNPRERITAAQALDHEYFWTDPLPADPKTYAHFLIVGLTFLMHISLADSLPMKLRMSLTNAVIEIHTPLLADLQLHPRWTDTEGIRIRRCTAAGVAIRGHTQDIKTAALHRHAKCSTQAPRSASLHLEYPRRHLATMVPRSTPCTRRITPHHHTTIAMARTREEEGGGHHICIPAQAQGHVMIVIMTAGSLGGPGLHTSRCAPLDPQDVEGPRHCRSILSSLGGVGAVSLTMDRLKVDFSLFHVVAVALYSLMFGVYTQCFV